jgi:hypothetical protein
MNEMNITSAQYVALREDSSINTSIKATIDGVDLHVPIATGNRHYDEIQRQVAAGTLTIQDAD